MLLSRADLLMATGAFLMNHGESSRPAALPDTDEVLRTLKPGHPRLIASSDTWDKIKAQRKTDLLLDAFLARDEIEARALFDTAPMEYKKDGKRLLHVSRVVLRRVLLLSLHYHLTGEAAFAKRAEAEMLVVSAFSDWNPSHFLDVGEMTLALALGYDWLYDALPLTSRKTVETAILQKGLSHGVVKEDWQTATNNWNSVCWGGLTLGALAIADVDKKTAAQIVEKAAHNNGFCLGAYAPDGVYPEGAMYWGYGTTFQAVLIAGLRSALGTDFGLSKSPGLMESGPALLQQLGPTGAFFNFSDNQERPGIESGMWWFAHTLNRPDLLGYSLARFKEYAHSTRPPQPTTEADRLQPLAALWWTPVSGDAQKLPPLSYYGRGPNALAIFRSSWSDTRAMFLACKGGSPSLSHAHMDGGSFVFEANGVRWAQDLGMQDYLSLESKGVDLWNGKQDSQRWDVFRIGPFAHNTLIINDRKHRVNGMAKITHFGETGDTSGAIVDLSPLFASLAQTVRRGFAFRANHEALVKDELSDLKTGDTVRWAMLTHAGVRISPDGTQATLTQNGETLRVLLGGSAPARWEVVSAEPPRNNYDAPNPGAYLLVAHFTAPASGKLDIDVVLQPVTGGTSETLSAPAPWSAVALSEWPLSATT